MEIDYYYYAKTLTLTVIAFASCCAVAIYPVAHQSILIEMSAAFDHFVWARRANFSAKRHFYTSTGNGFLSARGKQIEKRICKKKRELN